MNLSSAASRWIAPVLVGLLLLGCDFPGGGVTDEKMEAHFQTGRIRLQGLNYKGAAESFEKALEVNPQSSSAHLELGLLYGTKLAENLVNEDERDRHYATAIYHFENFLRLSPNSPKSHLVRQQISACKLELARKVSFALLTSTTQNELERLNRTNAAQRAQIEQLRIELAQQAFAHSNRLAGLQAEYAAALNSRLAALQASSPSNAAPLQNPRTLPPPAITPPTEGRSMSKPATPAPKPSTQPNSRPASPKIVSPRSYKVVQGDTPASIARKHGISLPALQSANPSLEPRRMRAGQVLTIPSSKN